jgi:hypothetical protein
VRRIQHDAIDLRHACSAGLECGEHAFGPAALGIGGAKTLVDDVDLRRMYRRLRGESVAAGRVSLVGETLTIPKIGEYSVDRDNSRGASGEQAEAAGERERRRISAVLVAVGFSLRLLRTNPRRPIIARRGAGAPRTSRQARAWRQVFRYKRE